MTSWEIPELAMDVDGKISKLANYGGFSSNIFDCQRVP